MLYAVFFFRQGSGYLLPLLLSASNQQLDAAAGSNSEGALNPTLNPSVSQADAAPRNKADSVGSMHAVEVYASVNNSSLCTNNSLRASGTSKLKDMYVTHVSDGYSAGVGKVTGTGSLKNPSTAVGTQLSTIPDSTSDNVRPPSSIICTISACFYHTMPNN